MYKTSKIKHIIMLIFYVVRANNNFQFYSNFDVRPVKLYINLNYIINYIVHKYMMYSPVKNNK